MTLYPAAAGRDVAASGRRAVGGRAASASERRRDLRRPLAALLAAALAVALTGCSGDDSPSPDPPPTPSASPTPPPTAAPPPAAPEAGACYRIGFDDALAPSTTAATTSCKGRHTSQTYAVGRLDPVVAGHLLAVDSDRVRAQAASTCPTQLGRWLAASPEALRLSLLRPVWFTPTLEDADAGASWYRCDVIAVTGDDQLATTRGTLKGVMGTEAGREDYAMCGTAQPGAPAFAHVLCREDHTWRAISVVDLADLATKGGGYPGVAAVRDAGEDGTCSDAAREVAADALDFQWGYEWPTKAQWRGGQTYGRCWAPDAG